MNDSAKPLLVLFDLEFTIALNATTNFHEQQASIFCWNEMKPIQFLGELRAGIGLVNGCIYVNFTQLGRVNGR